MLAQSSVGSTGATFLMIAQNADVLQVRVLRDHSDMMSKEGKIVLKKDTVHMLPLDEVEHLMRAGIVEYLHAGLTM